MNNLSENNKTESDNDKIERQMVREIHFTIEVFNYFMFHLKLFHFY